MTKGSYAIQKERRMDNRTEQSMKAITWAFQTIMGKLLYSNSPDKLCFNILKSSMFCFVFLMREKVVFIMWIRK